MENASKALLMGAGILFAVMLLSGLLILWSNISKSQSIDTGQKDEQLANFNMEFETYCKENIYGSEILTILNKIASYNENPPDFFNSKVQYEQIKLLVNLGTKNPFKDLEGFKNLSGQIDFTDVKGTGKEVKEFLSGYASLEEEYRKKFYE